MNLSEAKEIVRIAKRHKKNINNPTRFEMLCEFERLLNAIR